MRKTILITGSTDGIGLETAKKLVSAGHRVLRHGRSYEKLKRAENEFPKIAGKGCTESWTGDLSKFADVVALAEAVSARHDHIDVLINNAGVFGTQHTMTEDGLDVRFVVNTIAPFLLTQRLLPVLGVNGRVVNVSSAAQERVDLAALRGEVQLGDMPAYAQSKLAITMWSAHMARSLGGEGPAVIAVNPGSLLGSKMVKDAFGVAGGDLGIGADILSRAAVSDEFADASGRYFDNDAKEFAPLHPDAQDAKKSAAVVTAIEEIVTAYVS